MKTKYILIFLFALFMVSVNNLNAQEPRKDISSMTKDDILKMTYDELLELPFADLLKLAEIVGVSADELLEMILNMEVSSASKKVESLFDTPISTSGISKEEIIQSGVINIPEALRLLPGVIVREKTPGNYDIHIRGNDNVPPKSLLLYSENSLSLVMIDNRPVYNHVNGGTFWETLPVDLVDVERIEIIRGPSSALYGPNAVSGAINIITKRAEDKKLKVNADIQGGNINTKIGNASVSFGANDKLKFRLSGNYQHMDRFDEDIYVWPLEGLPFHGYTPVDVIRDNGIEADFDNRIPDPTLATDKYGANAFIYYDVNDDIRIDFAAGLQNSGILTTILSDHPISLTRRLSNTNYFDFRSKIYGLNAQVSYLSGNQELEAEFKGLQADLNTLNATLEYDYTYKNLTLRPGVSYQQAIYDDSPYVNTSLNEGYLNGEKTLSFFAYYLRMDYKLQKIRLIAALRADKYNKPDDTYLSYQFVGSYKLNDKNIFRAVYSRANRGPFMADVYGDMNMPEEFSLTQIRGNENLDLATMDMVEIGFRNKWFKNIQADCEFFYSKTKNFGYVTPDSVSMTVVSPDPFIAFPHYMRVSYHNLDVVSEQIGFSASVNWVVNEKMQIKAFGTIQKTELTNYYPLTIIETVEKMSETAIVNGIATGNFLTNVRPDTLTNITHESTPSFYGGISINYAPIEKLNIFSNLYLYSKQTFSHMYETVEIDPKAVINMKVSYKIWKNNSVYLNVRNLLNSDCYEFAFTDKIRAKYLVGLNINF